MMTSDEKKKSVIPIYRITTLICVGIGFCVYLIYLSYFTEAGQFCEIFGTDCSAVIHSPYGSFGGISTASLGLSYFIFHLSLLIGLNRFRADAPAIVISTVFFLSIIGIAFSLYFIYLLNVVLEQSCFACYGVHVINAILFVQYFILIVRHRSYFAKQRLIGFLLEPKSNTIAVFSLLVALNVVFGANLLEARYQLASERQKLEDNLQYFKYLYKISEYHEFEIVPSDILVGEKRVAIHQIVMFYKDGCDHCRQAREKLANIVDQNYTAVYLVLKNIKNFTPHQLKTLAVTKTPTVFIDGKMAVGWEMPGFLNEFKKDCGC
jgi:uncharacterized membrane protein/glutaredoxin